MKVADNRFDGDHRGHRNPQDPLSALESEPGPASGATLAVDVDASIVSSRVGDGRPSQETESHRSAATTSDDTLLRAFGPRHSISAEPIRGSDQEGASDRSSNAHGYAAPSAIAALPTLGSTHSRASSVTDLHESQDADHGMMYIRTQSISPLSHATRNGSISSPASNSRRSLSPEDSISDAFYVSSSHRSSTSSKPSMLATSTSERKFVPTLMPTSESPTPKSISSSASLLAPTSSPIFALPRTPDVAAFFTAFTPTINGRRFSTTALVDPELLLQPMKASALFVAQLDPAIITFFLTSITFTISRKLLLRQPEGIFPFPFILLGTQAGFATFATHIARRTGTFRATRLTHKRETTLRFLALLFSVEELTSTLSLRSVTVPSQDSGTDLGTARHRSVQFHLSVRALSPILTLALSVVFFKERTSMRTTSTFLLVILGVVLTSLNLDIHSFGSFLVFASAILLSIKSLITTHLLTERWGLGTLDLVSRIAPLSIVHYAIFAILGGELGSFLDFLVGPELTQGHLLAIVSAGLLSAGSIFATLKAEERVQAPAPAISAHASQAFTIVVSVIVFALPLSIINFLGVALTLTGGVLYAWYDALDHPPLPFPMRGKSLPSTMPPPSGRGLRL
ncbi:BZ3500_MvSof-1268-A1-R1_Chr9g10889 [Microbotryum saponariae]|uniref:BZ3500_MvSof-1268-A1-R1_Chr9g10889 protein n=1 Tax=Microbotryum saponariae TaxID=289078 RepID=A0A2X0N7Q6_9BASI|nr:BZ3501_MvSof-1269-A2-R1_Chr9g10637 [Microbotryum saponariae]SDA00867.1 BZ3500_MvSof-1268-A1-R1_Chr9g10889 [Microbotryum saponariae]